MPVPEVPAPAVRLSASSSRSDSVDREDFDLLFLAVLEDWKSDAVRFVTGRPDESWATTVTLTRRTPERKVGCCADGNAAPSTTRARMTGRRTAPTLLRSQRDHRIDPRRAPRRDCRGAQRHRRSAAPITPTSVAGSAGDVPNNRLLIVEPTPTPPARPIASPMPSNPADCRARPGGRRRMARAPSAMRVPNSGGALRHRVRHHAEEPGRRQQQRDQRESAERGDDHVVARFGAAASPRSKRCRFSIGIVGA